MDEFSARDLYSLLKLRVDVFVVEQECAYPELDGKDVDALHLRLLAGDELLASVRLILPVKTSDSVKIGRVVVSPSQRGKGLGVDLMNEAIAECERLFPTYRIALSAQSHLHAFYGSFGFESVSEEYLEDGIPHIDMVRPPASAAHKG
jgi:ElaA protein